MGEAFRQMPDQLVAQSEGMIDRPKGSAHPRYPHCIYPLDYGYLRDTATMDGGGRDVWRGSDAIVCPVDRRKRRPFESFTTIRNSRRAFGFAGRRDRRGKPGLFRVIAFMQ